MNYTSEIHERKLYATSQDVINKKILQLHENKGQFPNITSKRENYTKI